MFDFVIGFVLIGLIVMIGWGACSREELSYKLRAECLKTKTVDECNRIKVD